MALQDQVNLDTTAAQRQIAALEAQLAQLSAPVSIPVQVQGGGQLDAVRNDLAQSEDAVEALNRELAQTDDELNAVGSEASRTGGQLESAARRGASAFGGLLTSVRGLIGVVGLAVVGREVAQFASQAVTAASDLEQSVGALEAVFGDLGAEVAAVGEAADQALGLSASQFNQLASLLGSQLQTFGFGAREAATETQRLIGLSADLAATFGGPVSQAVEAVSSLLRGEVNPIERYGVAMNETLVQAKALELGLANTTAELSLQDKTLARLQILWEQTANAQGQFNREADTTAGRLERIRADFANFTAEAGEALLPAFESLLDAAPALVEAVVGLIPVISDLADEIADIDFADLIRDVRTFGNTVSGVIALLQGDLASATLSSFINDFNTSVEAGIDPARAFEGVLRQFAGFRFDVAQTLDADQVQRIVVQLQDLADIPVAPLRDLRDRVAEFGQAAGLSEPEIVGITRALDQLIGTALAGSGATRDFPLFEALSGATATVDEAADRIPVSIAEIEEALRGPTRLNLDFSNIETAFNEALPNALGAAAEALRNEENEIITDFGTFLNNLREELQARVEFEQNLDLLRSLGFDDLATAFEQAGIDSAGALADGLSNPSELAAAEAALEQAARDMAQAEAIAFGEEVRSFIEGFPVIEMPIVIVPDFNRFDVGNFRIPTDVAQRVGVEPGSIGGVNVTQIYTTEPAPNPTTIRMGQDIAALVR